MRAGARGTPARIGRSENSEELEGAEQADEAVAERLADGVGDLAEQAPEDLGDGGVTGQGEVGHDVERAEHAVLTEDAADQRQAATEHVADQREAAALTFGRNAVAAEEWEAAAAEQIADQRKAASAAEQIADQREAAAATAENSAEEALAAEQASTEETAEEVAADGQVDALEGG